jgi:hypothetical protein
MPFDVRYLENVYGTTWNELVELEPRLGVLLREAKDSHPTEVDNEGDFERCWAHYKEPIADLVGWHRRQGDEELRTTAAYEIAYSTLWHALHD